MAASPPNPPPPFAPHPSPAELIDSYLRPRVVSGSGTKVAAFIHETDLYASGPDDVTSRFPPVIAGDGEEAWYFFTKLRLEGGPKGRVRRAVDTGEGSWTQKGSSLTVAPNLNEPPQTEIGRQTTFAFTTKDERQEHHYMGWYMVEFRLVPNHGNKRDRRSQEADPDKGNKRDQGSQEADSGPIVLCKLYRSRLALKWLKAQADDEASAAAGVAGPGCEEDEETDSDVTATAAGLGPKRKAGDQDPGAETAAPPLGHQKTAATESAGAATTGRELGGCDDRRASRDAAGEEELKAPAETEEEEVEAPAETEEPRDPSETQFFDFLANWDK